MHNYLKPFWQIVGQKVGPTSVRYIPVCALRAGPRFWDSGALSEVDEIPALCMNRDTESSWQSGVLTSGLLSTEVAAKLETGMFKPCLGHITEEVLALICAFQAYLGLGIRTTF